MTEDRTVGVIGLGSMGYGMAMSLIRAGFTTFGADVDAGRMAEFQQEGGQIGLIGTAGSLHALVVVVLNAAQTEAVLFGHDGVVAEMAPGSVVISCATVAPDFARDMAARCAAYGVHYLDAPISGGAARAAVGRLSVMASGSAQAFETAGPVLEAVAERVFELGEDPGAGSAMKAVNQMLAGVHIAAMAEAMTFAIGQGIPAETFLEVIPNCAGTSWMLENRAPHVVSGDYRPLSRIDIWPKDLGIVLDIARRSKFSAPLTATALQQFVAAAGMGLGGEDDAALAKVYAAHAGLRLPGEDI